ncbi:MAG: endonuclease/exonuclease/phosphatase family protein [Jatrophihabitans sp.]|uniref:endonuclease/exonuclease/phosphatase family protein n=1 Tax=Jatrophihabitans sp. TaxID=1932789 RepID=UPI00390F13D1
MTRRSLLRVALVATSALLASLLTPMAAQASAWPSQPTGVVLRSTTSSSFTVALTRGTNVASYVLWASTAKSDLYYTNLIANKRPSTLHYGTSTSPLITVGGLAYTTRAYYYRVEARNGGNRSFSASIYSTGLRPAMPTGLRLTAGPGGTYLTWTSSSVTGYTVQQATNSAMTAGLTSYSISGNNHQFTPYGLTVNSRYFFRIRAVNHNSVSSYTAVVDGVTLTREQGVRVMTYNVLELTQDGAKLVGGTVAPWSQRRLAAASLVHGVQPDVIGVQEAWPWVGSTPGVRQVDSLCSALNALGDHYVVARTEIPYPEPGWGRYGDYIVYNSLRFRAVGAVGRWTTSASTVAVYQELQSVATGAVFLFVTTHLTQGGGSLGDTARADETKSMLAAAGAQAATDGVPVVYSGDFNSNPTQSAVDGPGAAMQAARIADARLRAQYRVNEKYDSYNNYSRTPYPYSLFLDYIFAPPGVSASSWGEALNLSGGLMAGTIPSDHNPVYAWVRFAY